VTKTRKILQASQVLQRAVVDGSLAEAIFSQVAKLGGCHGISVGFSSFTRG
jgi:cytochrome c551/c552